MELIKYNSMNTNRKTAAMVGGLSILYMVVGIFSVAYAVDAPDYLINTANNQNSVLIAALFQLLMIPIILIIGIALYPVLKKYYPQLALGFVSFRIIACVLIFIATIYLLLILTLSQEFVKAGAPDVSHFQTLGVMLQRGRDLVNHIAMTLTLLLSDIIFYVILYKTKLVPRWLSGWGVIGILMSVFATFLIMFQVIEVISTSFMVLSLPLALQDIVLAIWLIVKGFRQTDIKSLSQV